MVRVTEELLRKRAEHNEGCLSTLEEITLHQFELERIELLGQLCRKLRIVYLQNNLIPRIENLEHLKELRYLNLAINNVERVENLQACEFLQKLDLTCNFVAELTSLESLAGNVHLREIFLTGNPCTNYTGYRSYVIHLLPQLMYLDGMEITKSERIKAAQEWEVVEQSVREEQRAELEKMAERREQKKAAEQQEKSQEGEVEPGSGEGTSGGPNPAGQHLFGNTPEERVAMHEELNKCREGMDQRSVDPNSLTETERAGSTMKLPKRTPEEEIEKYGRVLQKNEGKFEFRMDEEDPKSIILHVFPGKFLDSSLIDIDAHPTFIRLTIKGKVLQLIFPEEVLSDQGRAQRSEISGELLLTFPRVKPLRVAPSAAASTSGGGRPAPAGGSSTSSITTTTTHLPPGMTERSSRRFGGV